MQVFCFLVGSLSLLSVRRQKMQSVTLFDQRRTRRGSSVVGEDVDEEEIEFARVDHPEARGDNREETVALTATPLDVV